MYLEIAESDVVILSIAAALLVAAVMLEMLRLIIPDVYEWVADHQKIKREIKEARSTLEKLLARNQDQAAVRDRKNAERFRLKSQLSRAEVTLGALIRERVEVWHELGEQVVGDQLYIARVLHRLNADKSAKDFDSAPLIWRFTNNVRIWAQGERAARARLHAAFPAAEGYSTSEITLVQGASKPAETAAAGSMGAGR